MVNKAYLSLSLICLLIFTSCNVSGSSSSQETSSTTSKIESSSSSISTSESSSLHEHSFNYVSVDETNHNKTCECGYNELELHSWNNGEITQESSCFTHGNMRYTCLICGGYKDVELPLVSHTLTEHPAVKVTCKTDGNSLYYSCSVCNKYFSDNKGENEIEEDSWIISKLGGEHTYDSDNPVTIISYATPSFPTYIPGWAMYECNRCHTIVEGYYWYAEGEIPS